MTPDGVAHTHDNRTCWYCGRVGYVIGSLSLRVTEAALLKNGWRFLELDGRMVCPYCWMAGGPALTDY